ncbi:hypothetical protein M407DRAFT_26853 [Tulasnella calospora MUT 4182]|uniref:Uncharacterized protein n=1 Tax=Tulasnella calospora MUT 4182 TaxID=1051891 RepID=A0A0C3Q498_9AGAM|nr:hypothetical protein M407DRAFT_26853 [Tulasnella calospora MUT 4182]
MSNPLLAASDSGTHPSRQDGSSLVEECCELRGGETEKPQSHMGMRIGKPGIVKLSARDLLASQSEMRIYATEIACTNNGFQAGGTYANVSVATLTRTGRQGEESRKVAVKKFRFAINGDLTEERFLRVSPFS